ncbi:MAG: hypothetical protein R3Y24_06110 [Eubacteriales bacterium]
MERVFVEENNTYKIDFTSALWATDKLNELFHNAKVPLSDVDFIAETQDEILFVEYKNSNIPNAVSPEGFNPLEDKKISQVVKKYYDSLTYISALEKDCTKRKVYVYILEAPKADSVLRSKVRIRLKTLLPFLLQEQNDFGHTLIDDVRVVSIEKWNEDYPEFPIVEVAR